MVTINGVVLGADAQVEEREGITYIGLRDAFAALGGTVVWQARENQAVVTWRHNMLLVPASGKVITLNGEKKTISAQNYVTEGRLYIALKSLAEVFSGVLNKNNQDLELFLPLGLLSSCSFSSGSMLLQWTGNREVRVAGSPDSLELALLGTAWPEGLQTVSFTKAPEGHVVLTAKLAGAVEHTVSEQGLRLVWRSSGRALEGLVIALDAGHGGAQPGAIGYSGVPEKTYTRKVVDLVAALLADAGATIIDVRQNDEAVTLAERVNRARINGAKIFVSVHFNGSDRLDANGTETFFASGNTQGRDLAVAVQQELVASLTLRNRGVKQASFYVLEAFREIPAVLVEVGFITNPKEEEYLSQDKTIAATATAIAGGLRRFWGS